MTSCKCVVRFEAAQREFPCTSIMGSRVNQHRNMSCFSGGPTLVSTNLKSHTLKHEPRNLNPETYHPSKHFKFRRAARHVFQCLDNLSPQNISPTKTCKVLRAMFRPHAPIFHVPPCSPHPYPMTHPWHLNLFKLSHVLFNFHWITLWRQLMKVME
jgi:hypothetical protein